MGIIAAMEHIDRQSDDFPQRLESLVGLLMEEIQSKDLFDRNLDGSPFVVKIEKAIYNRLGITVRIRTTTHFACILPYYSNRNHIFLSEFFRGQVNLIDQSKLLRSQEGKQGSVNLHKATVDGIFSDYEHPLYLNFAKMMTLASLNSGEITAIILHELGHAFNACYYSDRTDRTNQVLASIHQRVMNRRGQDDLDYVYKELSKVTESVKKEEVDKLLNGSRVVAGLTWFKVVVGMVRSQMQNDRYNDTAYEELSDSFAGRFGYSRHLAIALDKLHQFGVEKSPGAMKLTYLIEFMVIIAAAAACVATLINPVTFTTGAIFAVMSLFWTYIAGEDFQDYTYDKLKDRYIRIRQDLIEQLKDRSLNQALVKNMLESIYALDSVIKETGVHRGLLNRFSNLIFSTNREALASIEAQKLLESLASNDLFVAAAELRTVKD